MLLAPVSTKLSYLGMSFLLVLTCASAKLSLFQCAIYSWAGRQHTHWQAAQKEIEYLNTRTWLNFVPDTGNGHPMVLCTRHTFVPFCVNIWIICGMGPCPFSTKRTPNKFWLSLLNVSNECWTCVPYLDHARWVWLLMLCLIWLAHMLLCSATL